MFRLWLILAVLASPVMAMAAPAQCDKPNILILLDVSGSMKFGSPSKLSQATAGIKRAVDRFAGSAKFGLMVYPNPAPDAPHNPGDGSVYGFCNVSSVVSVPFSDATDVGTRMQTYLTSTVGEPHGDYDTPIYQALDKASQLPEFLSGGRGYIVLVSDGAQDCCDSQNRLDGNGHAVIYNGAPDFDVSRGHINDCSGTPSWTYSNTLNTAEAARNRDFITELAGTIYNGRGLTIFPVGFAELTDALLLNRIASISATKRFAECDVEGTDPSAPDNCYHQADDADSLDAALSAIVRMTSEDFCDGFDNDCDGKVDNIPNTDMRLSDPCPSDCGGGKRLCEAVLGSGSATWSACDAPKKEPEECDGIDNDCDKQIDNFEGTTEKLTIPCKTCMGEGLAVCNGKKFICSAPEVTSPEQCLGSMSSQTPPPEPPKPVASPAPAPQAEPVPDIPPKQKGLIRDGCACSDTSDSMSTWALAAIVLWVLHLRRRQA